MSSKRPVSASKMWVSENSEAGMRMSNANQLATASNRNLNW